MKITRASLLHATVAIFVTSMVIEVTPIGLLINPEQGHLHMNGDNLTVVCYAFEPVRHCQFSFMKDVMNWEGPLLDLSEGARSPVDHKNLNEAILGYQYFGSGLKNGECGVTLHLKGWKRYIAGCRTRTTTGGWRYATMSFTADQSGPIKVEITPKVAVALPGSDVNLLCKAVGVLDWCRFDLPTKHIFLDQGADSSDSTSEHQYFGRGLANGECGVTLHSVSEKHNGFAWCGMVVKGTQTWERTAIPVIIAQVPSEPVLQATLQGLQLQATCIVTGGRPVPNITWYLNGQMLRQDTFNDVSESEWAWPTRIQTLTQKLKHTLVAADIGRQLKCEVSHMALPRPLVATQTLTVSTNVLCPPLTSKTVLITCTLGADNLDCSKPVPSATIASLKCKPGFKRPDDVIYTKTTCSAGGSWNTPVFKCVPDCGKRKTNSGNKLVAGGRDALVGEFPWHVAIYKKTGGVFKQSCGGTLIAAHLVISAAHCFWNSQIDTKYPPSEFKVAAGKHLRAWAESDERVQKRDVEEIRLKAVYRGRWTNFGSDIAIVRLSSAFEITSAVNLACVDWDNILERWQLVSGNRGIVAGWGLTQHRVQSDFLQYVELPYVSPVQCLESLTHDLKQLLTSDKFCAGFINNDTSVCGGDSGGGLMFYHNGSNTYFLRGIVSIAFSPADSQDTCFTQHYTAFSHFSQFISWVQDNSN